MKAVERIVPDPAFRALVFRANGGVGNLPPRGSGVTYEAGRGASKSINCLDRQCQLAQLCGESPFTSRIDLSAADSRSSFTVSSEAYAAARCNGVSPRVRTS